MCSSKELKTILSLQRKLKSIYGFSVYVYTFILIASESVVVCVYIFGRKCNLYNIKELIIVEGLTLDNMLVNSLRAK